MPPIVQKGISVTILTTIFTSLAVGLFTFFGRTAVEAHDTSVSLPYFVKTMTRLEDNQKIIYNDIKHLDKKNTEFILFLNESKIKDLELENQIRNCLSDIRHCDDKHGEKDSI